ncbi:MAG: RimK-like ATPgrasp N-terminal domain-containing protein [Burkholderiales bacterium]|nr:RimK-like ATPgrasp N-terminal domain-containing protein [Burkholderiales bacterium]
MKTLIVANEPSDVPKPHSHAPAVAALDYLIQPRFREATHVINLCRPLRYQGWGYYVSLLAEARGQQIDPSVKAIEDMHLAPRGVFSERLRRRRSESNKPCVAILYDPNCPEPPSNRAAIAKFREAAQELDMQAEIITESDADRLSEFDALFIRDDTNVNNYTYSLSRLAEKKGLIVMDDPDSILKCTNKVYLAELFGMHCISAPRTLLVHAGNIEQIIPFLGLPCILKKPDGAFSLGVVKVTTEEQLRTTAEQLLKHSVLIIAQEYLPTTFDWRIGIVDGKPLFACKYFMAPGHWQIIKRQQNIKLCEGQTSAIPLTRVPQHVMDCALKAASLIGNSFYGVDLKQIDQQCYVIEVNDNPNVDMGNEDGIMRDDLYRSVMQVFRRRIETSRHEPRP